MRTEVVVRSKKTVSLGLRIIKADRRIIDLGTVSSKPVIGPIQRWLRNWRISNYRESMGLPRKPTPQELSGGTA
ncbi:MAG: hypothetical protein WC736_15010 [Gallionella sp.]|jgi:hypothetical protein